MWLAAPRSSSAPHFDGQRCAGDGGCQVCADVNNGPNSAHPSNGANSCFMVSSNYFFKPSIMVTMKLNTLIKIDTSTACQKPPR